MDKTHTDMSIFCQGLGRSSEGPKYFCPHEQFRRNTILLFVEMGRRTSELTVRRSYAVDGRMHLEVPLSLSLPLSSAAARRRQKVTTALLIVEST